MKRKSAIWVVVLTLLILAIVGLYLYEVLWLDVPYTEHLLRSVLIVSSLVVTMCRLLAGRGKTGLAVYENAYAQELGNAFADQPSLRKKLLRACRLYNEAKYAKALKCLFALYRRAQSAKDAVPVLLFIALCYTDARMHSDGIKAYEELLKIDPFNAQAHNNKALLHMAEGSFETALVHYERAMAYKPDYYRACCNRANCYFRMGEYDNAIEDGLRALQMKNNGAEAAGLLAVIYALRQDEENKKKYYHLAITSGKSPEDLNRAIAYYLNELEDKDE